jgi:hypothetical protein
MGQHLQEPRPGVISEQIGIPHVGLQHSQPWHRWL